MRRRDRNFPAPLLLTHKGREESFAVKAKPAFRRERPIRPVGINLARFETRDEDVSVVIGAVAVAVGIENDDLRWSCVILLVE
jgi:hypothetical protein